MNYQNSNDLSPTANHDMVVMMMIVVVVMIWLIRLNCVIWFVNAVGFHTVMTFLIMVMMMMVVVMVVMRES